MKKKRESKDWPRAVQKGPKIVYLMLRFYNGWPEARPAAYHVIKHITALM